MAEICVIQSTMFRRVYKKLNPNEKADVDDAVAEIITNPEIGDLKIGDLAGIYVYKFKCNKQLTLLAYKYDPKSRLLLLLGSHENFYRDLKRDL